MNVYQVQTIMHERIQQAKGGAGPRAGGKRDGGEEERWSVKTFLGGQIREDSLKAWLKFLCFITLLFKWAVDKKKRGGTERIKAAAQEIHTGTTGHLDAWPLQRAAITPNFGKEH